MDTDTLTNTPEKRNQKGQYLPGTVGTSPGRPKVPEDLKQAFRALSMDALNVLKSIMLNPEARDSDRSKAADSILDRAWGKPAQAIEMSGGITEARVDISKLSDTQTDALLQAVTGVLFTESADS